MQFGLMTRGQYELGDDMQQRFAELAEQVRVADRLGFASLTKGSHYSAYPYQDFQQLPYLTRMMAEAPNLRLNAASSCCRCTSRSTLPSSWRPWMSCRAGA